MKIHTEAPPHNLRLAGYGRPKTGKTRTLAACCRALPEWFGERAIYVAADPDAKDLMFSGMLPQDAERMIAVEPLPPEDIDGPPRIGKKPGGNYSPLKEAQTIATYNWQAEYPDIKTIIIDTMTEISEQLMIQVALLEEAPADAKDGRVTFGTRGGPDYHVSPSRSDYGVAQSLTMRVIRNLLNQPMNVICLFHETYAENKNIGGPAAVGNALVDVIPGKFQHTLHFTNKKSVYTVHNSTHGVFLAGGRSPSSKPMPDIILDEDPVNFWAAFGKSLKGET